MAAQSIITLTTDFGMRDHFAGTMKGVMLSINPAVLIVDISHDLASYGIIDGAFTIAQAYSYFPTNTVHLVVVDPGVGSERRPLLVQAGKHFFVGPDNGVFSFIYEREERLIVRQITAEHYFLQPVSHTFHGRDIFAPAAAWISKGIAPERLGEEIGDYKRFTGTRAKQESDTRARGMVLKADKFGNLVTNFSAEDFPQFLSMEAPAFCLEIGGQKVDRLRRTFNEGAPGEVFAIVGSTGYLEIVSNRGSASRSLNAGPGVEIVLVFE